MAGYTVGINSETKAFKQGIQSGVIEPLEDAQKELQDLGRSKGPDQLERSIKDAQKATEKLADETRDTANAIEREYRDAYRKAKQSSDDGLGGMKEGAKEVTQEIGQNLGEAVSSVRGNLSDLGQVGQDTLGGLAATIAGSGPGGMVGAAALAAGAVGLGLVTAELEKQQEEAERLRERLTSAYQEAAESGDRYIDTAAIIANASDLMFNKDRADEWKNVQEDANTLGLDLNAVIRANSGDLEAQRDVQERINGLIQDSNSYEMTGTTNRQTIKSDVAEIRDRWADVSKATQEAADKGDQLRSVSSDMLLGLVNSASDAQQEVDTLGNKIVTFRDEHGEVKVFVDAQTGQATQNLDKFQGDADGVIDHVNGRDVVIKARADLSQARNELDSFITEAERRSFIVQGNIGGAVAMGGMRTIP